VIVIVHREKKGECIMGKVTVLAVCAVVLIMGFLVSYGVAWADESSPTAYMEAANQVIKENNRIDAEIQDVLKNAYVSIRPIHVVERLGKVNKDAYANWPNLFAKPVPDKYADLYFNLKKMAKLQMKRTCLIYDAAYKGWMEDRDKARPYKVELKRVENDYFRQKKLVEEIYATCK